jgi:hypothetical protein
LFGRNQYPLCWNMVWTPHSALEHILLRLNQSER